MRVMKAGGNPWVKTPFLENQTQIWYGTVRKTNTYKELFWPGRQQKKQGNFVLMDKVGSA